MINHRIVCIAWGVQLSATRKLPSISMNPNSVEEAYRELKVCSVVETRQGKGSLPITAMPPRFRENVGPHLGFSREDSSGRPTCLD